MEVCKEHGAAFFGERMDVDWREGGQGARLMAGGVAKKKWRYAPFEVVQETPWEVTPNVYTVGDGVEESLGVALEVVDAVDIVDGLFGSEVVLALASETVLRNIDRELVAL